MFPIIVPNRTHSYHHTALSEISNMIVGKLLLCTIRYHTLILSDVGYTDIGVQSMEHSGAEVKYGVPIVRGQWFTRLCQMCKNFVPKFKFLREKSVCFTPNTQKLFLEL